MSGVPLGTAVAVGVTVGVAVAVCVGKTGTSVAGGSGVLVDGNKILKSDVGIEAMATRVGTTAVVWQPAPASSKTSKPQN